MASPEPIGALLLAAGGGSRFVGATHKLLTPVGGQPLVRRVLEAVARSGLSPIIVVTGAVDLADELTRELPGHPRLVQVHHPHWQRGMASSLHAGFDEARAALAGYRPRKARDDAFWQGLPCAMLIDEVEAIWAAIAERDDWGPFDAKISAIRAFGAALAD